MQGALLCAHLEGAGFEAVLAHSGEDAVELIEAESFDVVLTDVVLPGIDGYEVCRRAKERTAGVPVVLLTSLTDPIELVHALEAGADNFLRKPYTPDRLISRLHDVLRHRQMRAGDPEDIGVEATLANTPLVITAERQQIVNLMLSSFEDLVATNTELHERQAALEAAHRALRDQLEATEGEHRRLSALLAAAPSPIIIVDAEGKITDASERAHQLFARPGAQLVGTSYFESVSYFDANMRPIPLEDRPLTRALRHGEFVESGADFDLYVVRPDGSRSAVVVTASPVRDTTGTIIAGVSTMHEIGALGAYDPVTRLPNQARFAARVGTAVATSAQSHRTVAVVACVLDRFSRLRDSLDPDEANVLLGCVADRLREFIGTDDWAAHQRPSAAFFGDDVFAVVLPGLSDDVAPVRLAHRLHGMLVDRPYDTNGYSLALTATLGVAVGDGGGSDPIELTASAVAAARRAAARGGNVVAAADPSVDIRARDRVRREAELRAAIDHGELVVHYQPTFDLRSGQPVTLEALVRWQHPTRGLLGAPEFLGLARETNLIGRLGWVVLEAACAQVAAWRAALAGAERLGVAVNIDSSQLVDPLAADHVRAALAASGLPPDALVLEITEQGAVDDIDAAVDHLLELKRLGARLAIDDFGTGYSSLVQLRRLPVDLLKIDKSFIAGMSTEPDDVAIVAATVRLARSLGMETVAEGVEREDQLVRLQLLDCDLAQGYLWARPLSSEQLEHWWRAHVGRDAAAKQVQPSQTPYDAEAARLDETIAFIEHELRSPLTVITGYAEMAAESADERLAPYIAAIRRSAHDLDQRLAMLSELRELGQGAMSVSPEPVDVSRVVRDLVADMAAELRPHQVRVEAPPEAVADVDPSRLRQALANLLANAAKFSPAGGDIEVTVRPRQDVIEIAVADRGPGIPEDRRPELFRRFSRLGSRKVGMGVGLYLVRAIARAQGGDVWYEPRQGGGSRFVVSLRAA